MARILPALAGKLSLLFLPGIMSPAEAPARSCAPLDAEHGPLQRRSSRGLFGSGAVLPGCSPHEEYRQLAEQRAAEKGIPFHQAYAEVVREHPEIYGR